MSKNPGPQWPCSAEALRLHVMFVPEGGRAVSVPAQGHYNLGPLPGSRLVIQIRLPALHVTEQ